MFRAVLTPKRPYMVMFLNHAPITTEPFTVDPSQSFQLPLGRVHYLYSGGLDVGYIVEIIRQLIRVNDNHISVVHRSHSSESFFNNWSPVLNTGVLTAFVSGDQAMLLVKNQPTFIDIGKI